MSWSLNNACGLVWWGLAAAIDDKQLEHVRSKRWGAAFKKAREESDDVRYHP